MGEDAFHAAHRFAIEVRGLEGEDVSWRERQLEKWRELRDLEDVVTHAERVTAGEPEIPEAIRGIDNRPVMRAALGRPSEEHRRWSELLGGRTL